MSRSTEQIKKEVVDSLFWDSRVDASAVKVTVFDGCVRLEGLVPSSLAKAAATEDAEIISGVLAVDNDLSIAVRARPQFDDESLTAAIRHVLEWHAHVDASGISVSVDGGHVTLEGSVRYYWEKLIAEDATAAISGVVEVTNTLTVVPTDSILDKTIGENIIAALERQPLVDVNAIDVSVRQGVVTLSGRVPTTAARHAARHAARYTAGVIDLKDNIVIQDE